jgi:tetratricopeptide (TPR) repeat protein
MVLPPVAAAHHREPATKTLAGTPGRHGMALADWFRPKWRHSNPSIRATAVRALTNPAIVARVAKGDVDADVRRLAVEMLTDESVLSEVAKTDADEQVRALALGRVSEATFLADIVQKGRPGETRAAALARLSEPMLLEKVATSNDDPVLRKSATLRVTDTTVLGNIVMKDSDVGVRQAAIPRVTETSVLSEVIKTETDASLHQFAIARVDVSQVTDELVLAEVAKRHQGPASRKAAAARIRDSALLMTIADGAEDKDLRELALRRVTDQSLLAAAVIEGGDKSLALLKYVNDTGLLARIAQTAQTKECREKAVSRLEDETVLAEVANRDPEPSVRAQAGKRLPAARWKELLAILNAKKPEVLGAPPAMLAEIARKAIDEEARSAAVMRLVDGAVLAQVAAQDVTESVRRDARQRITILECEQRASEGNATGEDLREIGVYYQTEDARKAIRYLTDAIGRTAWLQGLPWRERMTIYEARAAAYLGSRQYDAAIADFEHAIEECKEPGGEYQVLRKRSACYKEMGMEEQAQADRAAASKAQETYSTGRGGGGAPK